MSIGTTELVQSGILGIVVVACARVIVVLFNKNNENQKQAEIKYQKLLDKYESEQKANKDFLIEMAQRNVLTMEKNITAIERNNEAITSIKETIKENSK